MDDCTTVNGLYHSRRQFSRAEDSFAIFRQMKGQGLLCDVVLETEMGESKKVQQHLAAHRVVLAAASPYFKAMFATNLLESTRRCVLIRDIEPDILEAVVAYAYDEDFFLPKDRVLLLLIAADLFQMSSLCQECCTFLEAHLQPENCLGLRAIADMHNCPALYDVCTSYTATHFEQVISCDEYLSLPPDQLKDLISRDEIRVTCEEQVYSAVLQWVYCDLESRRDAFPAIMSHVRLPFVSSQFLSGNVEQEDLVRSQDQCQRYVQEAYEYKNSPEKRSLLRYSPRSKPRKVSGVNDVIVTVGGMCKNNPIAEMEQYDPATDSWSILGEMEEPRFGLCACYHDRYLYTVGGFGGDNKGYSDALERYDLREKKWQKLVPMKEPRRYHSIHVLYGLIYATGGQNSQGVLSSVERYNPDSNSWMALTPMTSPRMYHGLADMDGFLFAVGGHSGQCRLSSMEFYDPSKDMWMCTAPMQTPRSVVGVASLGGTIYAVGGYNGQVYMNSVESYDIEMNRWEVCPPLCCSRSAMGLVAHGGSLYACGGFNGSFESSVEKYCPSSRTWEICASMNIEKVHFGIICT